MTSSSSKEHILSKFGDGGGNYCPTIFEVFPPHRKEGEENLHLRVDRLGHLHPSLFSVASPPSLSGAKGAAELALTLRRENCVETQIQIPDNLSEDEVNTLISAANGSAEGRIKHALVVPTDGDASHTAESYNDSLCLAADIPCGSGAVERAVKAIKAGADYVVAEMVASAASFQKFREAVLRDAPDALVFAGVLSASLTADALEALLKSSAGFKEERQQQKETATKVGETAEAAASNEEESQFAEWQRIVRELRDVEKEASEAFAESTTTELPREVRANNELPITAHSKGEQREGELQPSSTEAKTTEKAVDNGDSEKADKDRVKAASKKLTSARHLSEREKRKKRVKEAVTAFWLNWSIALIEELKAAGVDDLLKFEAGFYFLTMNLEKVITKASEATGLKDRAALPWRKRLEGGEEEVRPIHWANNPRSYLNRTRNCSSMPCGRWGKEGSGDGSGGVTFEEAEPPRRPIESSTERLAMWGPTLHSQENVFNTFAKYLERKIRRLPWCDSIAPETDGEIKEVLLKMNLNGYLTINSQPAVNGVSSSHPVFGWGPKGGYIYQKAYIEFFTSPENLAKIKNLCSKGTNLTYIAANVDGDVFTNNSSDGPVAVTWGVFPRKEVLQPTIVDRTAFLAWKEEAFSRWNAEWGCLYPFGSPSRRVIEELHDTSFLVSLVDNDYVESTLLSDVASLLPSDSPLRKTEEDWDYY